MKVGMKKQKRRADFFAVIPCHSTSRQHVDLQAEAFYSGGGGIAVIYLT